MEPLIQTPPRKWKSDQVIVLDWYDGPRSGFARMKAPKVEFQFDLLAKRSTANDLDDRLFTIKNLPPGTLERLLSTLCFAGAPTTPIWVPRWESADRSELDRANHAIAGIKSLGVPTTLIIRSSNFIDFRGCWDIKATPRESVGDWFAHLNV